VIVTAAKPDKRCVWWRSSSRSGGVPKAHAAAVRDSDVGLAALLATVRRISRLLRLARRVADDIAVSLHCFWQ
jgi:hypothetical protein